MSRSRRWVLKVGRQAGTGRHRQAVVVCCLSLSSQEQANAAQGVRKQADDQGCWSERDALTDGQTDPAKGCNNGRKKVERRFEHVTKD